ncbi:MAG: hypothetical protein AAFU80_05440 [Pseudomonadota bacterium]
MPRTVLMIITSTGEVPVDIPTGEGPEIGFDWLSVAAPYWRLRGAGVEVGFASPLGGKPPGDAATAENGASGERFGAVEMFLGDEAAVTALSTGAPLHQIDPEAWDAVLIADGTGVPWDLYASEPLAALLSAATRRSAIIAAIGRGAAALAGLRDEEGRSFVAGRRVTTLADGDLDPATYPSGAEAPAARLDAAGALLQRAAEDDPPIVVEDGLLITGESRETAAEVALKLIDTLDARRLTG